MYPVLYSGPHFTIYSYGLCVALAVLAAWLLSMRLAARSSMPASQAGDLLFIVFVAGLAGARLFYVLQHSADFKGRWIHAFSLTEGGLVWYGGFIVAVASAMVYTKVRGLSVLGWADFFAPVLPVAQAIGRVGCFLNGCCFGKGNQPVQLYEAAFSVVLSFYLFQCYARKEKHGEVFARYLIGYGSMRFVLEFLRGDQQLFAWLTLPQWISLPLVVAGFFLLKRRGRC